MNNCHNNDYLQKSFNKYGLDCFSFYILEKCSPDDLDEREIYYIDYYKTLNDSYGYNLKAGGQEGAISEYGKIKKSNSLKYTYQNTDLKEKRRQDAFKQWSNPEIKAKHMGENNGMYGKTHSKEARKKMSDARKSKIPVFCQELNRIFDCAVDAAKELNLRSDGILCACKGRYKSSGGYHWNFVLGNN